MSVVSSALYPVPSQAIIKSLYLGKSLHQIPTPAAVLDRAVVSKNCKDMLDACEQIGCQFRPHLKTHKTAEVTRLQVGNSTSNVNVIVSTVSEGENLLGYFRECQGQGRSVNILYGVPVPLSQVTRLAQLAKELGPGSVSILVDNVAQLGAVRNFKSLAGFPVSVFVKIDTGYHRAGVQARSTEFSQIVEKLLEAHLGGWGTLQGLYSHAGHSYSNKTGREALDLLEHEIDCLEDAAKGIGEFEQTIRGSMRKLVLSVGATPTATSIQNLLNENSRTQDPDMLRSFEKLRASIERINREDAASLELHAGVYPFLDMQQLSTHARSSTPYVGEQGLQQFSTSDLSSVALTILAEVVSIYPSRPQPEALVAAGSLALGRDPCMAYDGMGVVSNWGMALERMNGYSGWKIARIAQEHGILKEEPSMSSHPSQLRIGQIVRIIPNHACIAGAGYGWYFIVDSSLPEERRDEIVDIWVRWRGW